MTADGQIIHEDIRQLAKDAWAKADAKVIYADAVDVIAKAILTERERCAAVADRYGNFKIDTEHGEGYATAASNIAAAIRTGA